MKTKDAGVQGQCHVRGTIGYFCNPQDPKSLENMRPCVKRALDSGSPVCEVEKMVHAIPAELRRLGYDSCETKELMLEWNKKCGSPRRGGEVERNLLAYVDWVYKKEVVTGCRALKDYCLGQDTCWYYQKRAQHNLEEAGELPFNLANLEEYLSKKHLREHYVMMLIVRSMRRFQVQKQVGSLIYISFRKISAMILDTYGHTLDLMHISRDMNRLIDEGVIARVEKGKCSGFSRRANGYVFLPWRKPKAAGSANHQPEAITPIYV